MAQQDEEVIEKQELIRFSEVPRTQASGYSEAYVNTANLVTGFYDISLIFGVIEVALTPGDRKVTIQDRVAVRMSWEHASALADLLQAKIADYEKKHGALRHRPDQPTIEA